MPNSNLSSPAVGMSLEELTNLMFQYYRELQYLLNGNLDEQNVIRAQSVIADWVYAGGITTDQITAGTAKITTAMIETLTVGDNVIMGEDAAISWSKVTDKPTIITTDDALTAWANSNYATYIDANGVYTGTVAANKIIIGGESGSLSFNDLSDKPSIPDEYTDGDAVLAIENTFIDESSVWTINVYAENIYGNTITGKTLQTAATGQRVVVDGTNNKITFHSSGQFSTSFTPSEFYFDIRSAYELRLLSTDSITLSAPAIELGGAITFGVGTSINFSGVTVSNLSVPAVFS